MGKRRKVNTLQDFFSAPDERPEDAVYFERISGYHPEIREFLRKFYTAAASNGVAAEGGIQNPDNSQLSFYAETMGNDFRMEGDFVRDQMGKWLPRLTTEQKDTLASAICETLEELHRAGKNEGSLKNVFVKFMCWLYYRFEPLFHSRSAAQVPKILYEGELSHHALLLLNILSSCGTDIVLLETDGDEAYRKLDPDNRFSEHFEIQDPQEFPAGFSLSVIRKEIQEQQERERLLGPAPCFRACTNTWMAGNVLQEIRKQPQLRGDDPTEYYNVFCRIRGVEDKVSYESELYRLQLDLKTASRKTVIVSNSIQAPTVEEFARIKRGNYQNAGQVVQGLVNNIQIDGQPELEQILRRAFTEAVLDEGEQPDQILGRLATEAACCLCWLKRYQKTLFSDWRMPDVGCFLYLGGCRNLSEALFCRFLAKHRSML